MMKFTRGAYGSVSFKRSGCTVRVYLPENEIGGWCISVGFAVYAGFASRRAAVESVGRYVA
jgi:hypothetical protein